MTDVPKRYLGGGVWAAVEKNKLIVTTEDGAEIICSPQVAEALLEFAFHVKLATDRQARRN